MEYGTILVGAPGSGKTQHVMACSIVNLDPANDVVPCDLNISDLISVDDARTSWLLEGLSKLKGLKFIKHRIYIELYTHNKSVKDLLEKLRKAGFTSNLIYERHRSFKYVAALVLSLKVMLQLELPHVNVLSKIDLIQSYGTLAFDLDYYTEVQDLGYLIEKLEQDKYGKRLKFGLVHFHTLCINDKASVLRICQEVEKANGFVYLEAMSNHEKFFNSVAPADMMYNQYIQDIKEKYVDPVLEV
ncbi:hypothetical protein BC829DRAFT_426048 [Chytridium lagenaria]|nr:hypothetical protein BC829DRAFT_426048 [Chytridium lagenaria]